MLAVRHDKVGKRHVRVAVVKSLHDEQGWRKDEPPWTAFVTYS